MKLSDMNEPLISIVVPTYNRKKLAERLLNSILKSTHKNLEIIVIDDASPDRTQEYLKSKFKDKKIKLFKNKKNLFAAGTKNEGLKRAKGKYIIFIDDDNVVDRNMLKELSMFLEENKDFGECGPINYSFSRKNKIIWCRSNRNMWSTKTKHFTSLEGLSGKKNWETDDIPNSFMVRKSVTDKYRITFKSKFGIMYEESDFAYRIKKTGYKIGVVREARIYHDIESENKDYLYHFLEDQRRPFVFARNRIIFHNLYSTRLQNVSILLVWIWFFAAYYCYKFFTYNGEGNFSILNKLTASLKYIAGTFVGIRMLITK